MGRSDPRRRSSRPPEPPERGRQRHGVPSRPNRSRRLNRAPLALVGATASGKSAVALDIARRAGNIDIVSVDSMQVYRGMDIGTAKATPAERALVPHHLLDLAEPDEDFSVASFCAEFDKTVAAIEAVGRRPLLAGGTGLYFRVVVDRLEIPGQYPEVRAELECEADTITLHQRLAALDPLAATRMEPTNRRRVLRALEVTVGSGRPFSSYGPGLEAYPPTDIAIAGLHVPKPVLDERIRHRVEAMINTGLVDEVETLRQRYPGGLSRTARQALGYREVLAHLEEDVPLDETIDEIVRRTIRFARRQRVWFRRDPRIRWYDVGDNPLAVVPALLEDWSLT